MTLARRGSSIQPGTKPASESGRYIVSNKTTRANSRDGRRRQQALGPCETLSREEPRRGRDQRIFGSSERSAAASGSDAGAGGFVRACGATGPRGGLLRSTVRHASGAEGRDEGAGDLQPVSARRGRTTSRAHRALRVFAAKAKPA